MKKVDCALGLGNNYSEKNTFLLRMNYQVHNVAFMKQNMHCHIGSSAAPFLIVVTPTLNFTLKTFLGGAAQCPGDITGAHVV